MANKPSSQFAAAPVGEDLFHWHFTIRGPPGTPFEGGMYHGRIILPPNYPYKPPHIIFLTPSGRFEVNKKICLSISAYHPESWQPSWTLRLMMKAIISFMPTPGEGAIAAIDAPDSVRRDLAQRSRTWRCPHCGDIHALICSPESADLDRADSATEVPAGLVFTAPPPQATGDARGTRDPAHEQAASATADEEEENDEDARGSPRAARAGDADSAEEDEEDDECFDDDDEDDDGINHVAALPRLPAAAARPLSPTPAQSAAAAAARRAVSATATGAERVLAAAHRAASSRRNTAAGPVASAGRRKTEQDTRTTAELVAELARLEEQAKRLREWSVHHASRFQAARDGEAGIAPVAESSESTGAAEEPAQRQGGSTEDSSRSRSRRRRLGQPDRARRAQTQPAGDSFLGGLAALLAFLIAALALRRVLMGPWRPLTHYGESFE